MSDLQPLDLQEPDSQISKRRRKELLESFRDPEVREAYAEGFLNTWIPAQLAAVRTSRGMTQRELAEAIGTKQPGVARMERDNYGKWNLKTLSRAAAHLGCWLRVSLETYSSLAETAAAFRSPEYLNRPTFEHDPAVAPRFQWQGLDSPGPVGYMRRQLDSWLDQGAPMDRLIDWLSGKHLPPAGDELPPSHWLREALAGCPAERESLIAVRLQELISTLHCTQPVVELMTLVTDRPKPQLFSGPLFEVYSRKRALQDWSVRRPEVMGLLTAMAFNQPGDDGWSVWYDCLQNATTSDNLLEAGVNVRLGLTGCLFVPGTPNFPLFIRGLNSLNTMSHHWSGEERSPVVLAQLRDIAARFPKVELVQRLHHAVRDGQVSEPSMRVLARLERQVEYRLTDVNTRDSTFIMEEFHASRAA